MKYHIIKHLTLLAALYLMPFLARADNETLIPPKPSEPRLVNDYVGILKQNEIKELEYILDTFALNTSTQIAVVIVSDLGGMDPNMFAFEILDKWGIGQKGKDNGVVILIKPKLNKNDRGQVSIQVGYGLESVIPDATAKLIIENEMIPNFKENDYYEGIRNAIDVIMQLSRGEFSAETYKKNVKSDGNSWIGIIVFFIIMFFVILGNLRKRNRKTFGRRAGMFYPFFGGISGGSFNRGNFNDFGGGFSDFGGFSGFGGFGGGTGGGGGASGSW